MVVSANIEDSIANCKTDVIAFVLDLNSFMVYTSVLIMYIFILDEIKYSLFHMLLYISIAIHHSLTLKIVICQCNLLNSSDMLLLCVP